MNASHLDPVAPVSPGLSVADLEQIYDELAQAVDAAGPEHSERLLAKFALLMAQALGDAQLVSRLITAAKADL